MLSLGGCLSRNHIRRMDRVENPAISTARVEEGMWGRGRGPGVSGRGSDPHASLGPASLA